MARKDEFPQRPEDAPDYPTNEPTGDDPGPGERPAAPPPRGPEPPAQAGPQPTPPVPLRQPPRPKSNEPLSIPGTFQQPSAASARLAFRRALGVQTGPVEFGDLGTPEPSYNGNPRPLIDEDLLRALQIALTGGGGLA